MNELYVIVTDVIQEGVGDEESSLMSTLCGKDAGIDGQNLAAAHLCCNLIKAFYYDICFVASLVDNNFLPK